MESSGDQKFSGPYYHIKSLDETKIFYTLDREKKPFQIILRLFELERQKVQIVKVFNDLKKDNVRAPLPDEEVMNLNRQRGNAYQKDQISRDLRGESTY